MDCISTLSQEDKPGQCVWWSAGAGVELMKVVLGGFVGIELLVQVLLTGADTDTNKHTVSKLFPKMLI